MLKMFKSSNLRPIRYNKLMKSINKSRVFSKNLNMKTVRRIQVKLSGLSQLLLLAQRP